MNEKLAAATAEVDRLGAEYRSGQTNSAATMKDLRKAIKRKLMIKELAARAAA